MCGKIDEITHNLLKLIRYAVINKRLDKFYKLRLFCLEVMLKSINYKCFCQNEYVVPKKTFIFLKKLYVSMINAISYWT